MLTWIRGNKRLISNIISMSSVQIISYILPLITMPYLVRVIGIEKFGLVTLVSSTMYYFVVVTDYGFNLSATKKISDFRENRSQYSKVFCEVFFAKVFLMIVSFFILFSFVFFAVEDNVEIYFLAFGVVLGQAFFPFWFFQGMEEMRLIALLNIASRVASTCLILVFVGQPNDFWMVPMMNSIGYIFSGLLGFYIAVRRYKIAFIIPLSSQVFYELKESWHVFVSRINVSLYTTTNLVVLGVVAGPSTVGYYTVAEKVVQAFSGLFSPVLQAFYPYLANLKSKSTCEFKRYFRNINFLLFFISLFLSFLCFVFKEEIVYLVAGETIVESVNILAILSISILTSPFGPSFTNGFMVLGQPKIVSKVVFFTMLFNLLLLFPLTYFYQGMGLAIVWVLGQFFHVSLYLTKYYKALKE